MIISTPSYIIPGTYLENITYLAKIDEIKNIELLFFLFDMETKNLLLEEIEQIKKFYNNQRFTFTLHMPDIIKESDEQLIEITTDFVKYYIIHAPVDNLQNTAQLVNSWQKKYGEKFLIENTISGNFDKFITYINNYNICADIGHLLINKIPPHQFITKYLPRIKEIHLHGIKNNKDHCCFDYDEHWFVKLIPLLNQFDNIVNIEVFNEKDFKYILEIIKRLYKLS